MYLTYEYLQEHGTCNTGLAWFKRHFPNGAELVDVINERTTSDFFIERGMQMIVPSPEEWAAYYKRYEIDSPGNEGTIFKSKKVKDSSRVLESVNVQNSHNIYNSENIQKGHTIFQSKEVEDGKYIYESSYVYGGEKIVQSTNINDSKNVFYSNFIVSSSNVLRGDNVEDSSFVVGLTDGLVKNVKNSHFVFNCSDISNCLFCSSIKKGEYFVFNQPVEKRRYDIIEKQLRNLLQEEELYFTKRWPEEDIPLITPKFIPEAPIWYSKLSPKFWDWVKTLPGYNPITLYTITYNKELLTKKK